MNQILIMLNNEIGKNAMMAGLMTAGYATLLYAFLMAWGKNSVRVTISLVLGTMLTSAICQSCIWAEVKAEIIASVSSLIFLLILLIAVKMAGALAEPIPEKTGE